MTRRKEIVDGKLLCARCKEWKPLSEFYTAKTSTKKSSFCKKCFCKNSRNNKTIMRYGISFAELEQMLWLQGHKCAICGCHLESVSDAAADHDHETNKLRAILCRACNGGIGLLKDNVELVYKAYLYLLHWRHEHAYTATISGASD
jgi:hypothetical protein